MTDKPPGFFEGTEMPNAGWWEALWPDPAGVLIKVGVKPGMDVIDLCSGDGWFTLQIARLARHVVAIDIEPALLDLARVRLRETHISNCDFVAGDAYDIARLWPHPVDFVFLAKRLPRRAVLQPRLVRSVRGALKPSGRFAIVNWHQRPHADKLKASRAARERSCACRRMTPSKPPRSTASRFVRWSKCRPITMPPSSSASDARHCRQQESVGRRRCFVPRRCCAKRGGRRRCRASDVPAVCILDPDGDIVRRLRQDGPRAPFDAWPCYHTHLDAFALAGRRSASSAAWSARRSRCCRGRTRSPSGCRLLMSLTSAGQIAAGRRLTPYFVIIDRALRDEGTSYHYARARGIRRAPTRTRCAGRGRGPDA